MARSPFSRGRRDFLKGAASFAWLGATGCQRKLPRKLDGQLLGPNHAWGHRLRDGGMPAPSRTRRTDVLIVGGGIAGLSAGWELAKAGVDFALLELENEAGGNARCGRSEVSGYPWGAHYLPLPTREGEAVVQLLRELDVVTGFAGDGSPQYDERCLLAPPDERLFQYGVWRPGLRPVASSRAQQQFARFDELIAEYSQPSPQAKGARFTTPTAYSAHDDAARSLDSISMAAWLANHGLDDPALRWYVDYACRDDFGCTPELTSAWAGIHYYAGRNVWGHYAPGQVLTWPEGNGWLAQRMAAKLGERIHAGRMAIRVAQDRGTVSVDAYDGETVERWQARQVILCTPGFVTQRIFADAPRCDREYHPWLVANLHVSRLPEGHGVAPAWDNVIYDSPGLGYVEATHQLLVQHVGRSVLTYYRPFPGGGAQARRALMALDWQQAVALVLEDLARAFPGLEELVERIDVWRWGHGMVAPSPGLLFGDSLARSREPVGRVHVAHSDLSGISLFEEAHHWGARAAARARKAL